MSIYVDTGTCEKCSRCGVEVVVYDNSGDEYDPGKICQRCITSARKAFRREQRRATPEEPTKTPCKRCHGKGSVPVGTMRVACSDCEGSGAAATQETRC